MSAELEPNTVKLDIPIFCNAYIVLIRYVFEACGANMKRAIFTNTQFSNKD